MASFHGSHCFLPARLARGMLYTRGGPCSPSFSVISLLTDVFAVTFFREMVLKGKGLGEEEEKERLGKNQCHWVLSGDFHPFGGFRKPSIIQQSYKPFLLWTPLLLRAILKIYTWLGFLKS